MKNDRIENKSILPAENKAADEKEVKVPDKPEPKANPGQPGSTQKTKEGEEHGSTI